MQFSESLLAGKESEEIVLGFIHKKYPSAFLLKGYCKQMDIFIPEKNESVEVKQDKKSEHTGNWVVEISFGGNPSGLTTTKANWWVFIDSEEMHFITPESIKDCIVQNGFKQVSFVGPGDQVAKITYLIPKTALAPYVSFTVPIN